MVLSFNPFWDASKTTTVPGHDNEKGFQSLLGCISIPRESHIIYKFFFQSLLGCITELERIGYTLYYVNFQSLLGCIMRLLFSCLIFLRFAFNPFWDASWISNGFVDVMISPLSIPFGMHREVPYDKEYTQEEVFQSLLGCILEVSLK